MMHLEKRTNKVLCVLFKSFFFFFFLNASVQPAASLHTDFLLQRGNSWKLCPGESVLSGEESPVWSLEPGEQPRILYDTELQ